MGLSMKIHVMVSCGVILLSGMLLKRNPVQMNEISYLDIFYEKACAPRRDFDFVQTWTMSKFGLIIGCIPP